MDGPQMINDCGGRSDKVSVILGQTNGARYPQKKTVGNGLPLCLHARTNVMGKRERHGHGFPYPIYEKECDGMGYGNSQGILERDAAKGFWNER